MLAGLIKSRRRVRITQEFWVWLARFCCSGWPRGMASRDSRDDPAADCDVYVAYLTSASMLLQAALSTAAPAACIGAS